MDTNIVLQKINDAIDVLSDEYQFRDANKLMIDAVMNFLYDAKIELTKEDEERCNKTRFL